MQVVGVKTLETGIMVMVNMMEVMAKSNPPNKEILLQTINTWKTTLENLKSSDWSISKVYRVVMRQKSLCYINRTIVTPWLAIPLTQH